MFNVHTAVVHVVLAADPLTDDTGRRRRVELLMDRECLGVIFHGSVVVDKDNGAICRRVGGLIVASVVITLVGSGVAVGRRIIFSGISDIGTGGLFVDIAVIGAQAGDRHGESNCPCPENAPARRSTSHYVRFSSLRPSVWLG